MAKISFIFPTFNESKFIGETLDQFKSFRGKYDFELVVADGLSKDNTVEVAKAHGADKVAVRKDGESTYISYGRNNGGHAADGDMLVWLDADMRVQNMELLFKRVLEIYENKAITGATCNIYVYPAEQTFFDNMFHGFVNLVIRSAYWFGSAAAKGECQIIRGATWREIGGYNDKLVVSEDIDMFKRLRAKGKVIFLNDVNMFESPRRYRKLGHIRVVYEWLANFFFFAILKRSYSKEWKAIR